MGVIMLETRYEEYTAIEAGSCCCLYDDLHRSSILKSLQMNWHENLELQFCTAGEGYVLLDGDEYRFSAGDIIVVNSNVIHYTSTTASLTYSALIISSSFCKGMGIDYEALWFEPLIRDKKILALFDELRYIYRNKDINLKTARLNAVLLQLLIELSEKHSKSKAATEIKKQSFDRVKQSIKYIKRNFKEKILLDDIAASVFADKYTLSREFKKLTGQTVIEYINCYRCNMAANMILSGKTVSEAAYECGFNSLSFFTKTFKTQTGKLPSKIKP